jgi:predicted ester cyclase
MSASVEALYRSFLQCVNDQRWNDTLSSPSARLNHNGEDESIADAIKTLHKAAEKVHLFLDAITVDEQSQCLGATVLVSVQPFGTTPDNVVQVIEQHFLWAENGKIVKIATMLDLDDLNRRYSDPDYRSVPLDPIGDYGGVIGRKLSRQELEEMYKAYIGCINAQTMKTELPKFCHSEVTHNAKVYPLDKYRGLMGDAFAAIPDIIFRLDTLVVDEGAQRVAVRIEFTGTPTGIMAGVKPTGRSGESRGLFHLCLTIFRQHIVFNQPALRARWRAGSVAHAVISR